MFIYILLLLAALALYFKSRMRENDTEGSVSFGFFHPFCSAGGGGERVLWHMIHVLQQHPSQHATSRQFTIYTVDSPNPDYKERLLQDVRNRFSIDIEPASIHTVHLHEYRDLLLPARRCSMLVESFNTMRLARQALQRHVPTIWVDTTGCAFAFLVARTFGVRTILAYVHYPTISTDMLRVVFERRPTSFQDGNQSSSILHAAIKCLYYTLFAVLYSLVGGCLCTCVLVNSTWTYQHIHSLWWYAAILDRIRIVYPPCGALNETMMVDKGTSMEKKGSSSRARYIISIGQFRPEKDHILQVRVMQSLLQQYPQLVNKVQLVIIGSCRGREDEERLAGLQVLAEELGLSAKASHQDAVQFVVNQPYSVVQDWLCKADIGLHTMWNEHFGIGVVEMMAAGVLTIAHDSGGPKSDILVSYQGHKTGFLASSLEEYVSVVHQALTMSDDEANAMRRAAQKSARRFTDSVFASSLQKALSDARII